MRFHSEITRALLIRRPWIDMILDGEKTWEMRGSKTAMRGMIGLIPSRSGLVAGMCEIVDCIGPLSPEEFRRNARKAGMRADEPMDRYAALYAWVVANPKRLKIPVPYNHPSGAVIWVRLDPNVQRAIKTQF